MSKEKVDLLLTAFYSIGSTISGAPIRGLHKLVVARTKSMYADIKQSSQACCLQTPGRCVKPGIFEP